MKPLSFALTLLLLPFFSATDAQDSADSTVPRWIWRNRIPVAEGQKQAAKVYFRKEIDIGNIQSARLSGSGDDQMKVYLDGTEILNHDRWEQPVMADLGSVVDLSRFAGKHVIAVEASNKSGAAGLLLQLTYESGDQTTSQIVTDKTWLTAVKPQKGWQTIHFKPNRSWKPAVEIAALGQGPWKDKLNAATLKAAVQLKTPQATPVDQMKVAKGFEVELLYSVPKAEQGSWVNMCVDPKGRLITSDQYGSLYRITPPGILNAEELVVEKINVDIGEAQGLLWAFDSLYVSVNKGQTYDGGLYRVQDTDGDDQLDQVELLRSLTGRGEHGPHAVLPHPDGKSLSIVCGNLTQLTDIDGSQVPSWDEDLLLPRVQGRFMRGVRAPGGVIYQVDPDGKTWNVIASGFRNQYDAAYDTNGELFAYDADMEWDINTPWYRPTRICHVVNGAEFGWRSGAGKWPTYYQDSVPPAVNIGPGSPTGVCFGYGARFPEKYQRALYACDWSYGKLYAVHLSADGATYSGQAEEFITGTPLPLTDVVVNPVDGAMYFTIGGRRIQSGLYKVTSQNQQGLSTDAKALPLTTEQKLRISLENGDIQTAIPLLGHKDRAIRYAARLVLERNDRDLWSDEVLQLPDPKARINGLLAYARTFQRQQLGEAPDIDSPIPDWSDEGTGSEITSRALNCLQGIDRQKLSVETRLTLLRALTVLFARVGPPEQALYQHIVAAIEQHDFATSDQRLNSEIAQMLVYFKSEFAAQTLVEQLEAAPTQEEQIDYARSLRLLTVGWTPELQERYFKWFIRAAGYSGGASFQLFVNNIKADAVKQLNPADKLRLQPILDAQPASDTPMFSTAPRTFVKKWTMDELLPLLETKLVDRDFQNGRKMFGAATCFACHRFDNQGGAVGPDLTSLAGRFSPRDILESVMDPSKTISDQYGSVQILTLDGKVITGRIINLAGDSFRIQTDMMKPGQLTNVDRRQIEEMEESKVSMMPEGLLNTLNEDEVLDLMAYLLSRGDRSNSMFAAPKSKTE